MAASADCIFCKIVAGEIPCFNLYEDDRTLAFMDINPANEGHALAIIKAHHENIHAVPDDLLGACAATAKRIAGAVEAAFSPAGINLLQANGPGAGQSVFHFHIHILPRRTGKYLHGHGSRSPMHELGQRPFHVIQARQLAQHQ